MYNYVSEINILDKNENIFNRGEKYIIPLYQRAYAWEDKQLIALIEDIMDIDEALDTKYYIGSLIVAKSEDYYEVVDGQQRLTSLYLLLNCLGEKTEHTLTFACREKSNETLINIDKLIYENSSKSGSDEFEENIKAGVDILLSELNKKDFNKGKFLQKLSKVVVYRIEVPENTDLNRYFEIMNTRGEQLEQHDILKARLMSFLRDSSKRETFAKIWDVCSDMSGYVQMHLKPGKYERERFFGDNWNEVCEKIFDRNEESDSKKHSDTVRTIDEIISRKGFLGYCTDTYEDDSHTRFESIIDFPYFLLHTLNVFLTHYKSEPANISLDDKNLCETFKKATEEVPFDNEEFAKKFISCLLRTRYLFDKYIIKREYKNDSADGEWSLKSLAYTKYYSQKRPYYKNSFTSDDNANIMIQSALRVSYTSPKVMHWITKILADLYENNIPDGIVNVAEKVAIDAVNDGFFGKCTNDEYKMGVDTPHIVFNYLDYLLWYHNRKKYDDFTFEFRNSVEHWYPRNPSEEEFNKWNNVDCFGNLCIIQRNINSKFSNANPKAKSINHKNAISKGSLKLRIMSEITESYSDHKANEEWRDSGCANHEKEMIKLLREACSK